jgi:diguanylate cyclase (GGDEF)-like protein/PAS domain S-box-containing protein
MQTCSLLRANRELLLIGVLCTLFLVVVWIVTLERISHEREEAIFTAQRANENLTLALEEQTTRALKAAEQVLLFMRHEDREDEQIITLNELVESGLAEDNIFAGAFVVDGSGSVLLRDGTPGPTSVADRQYFLAHRGKTVQGVTVSEPISSGRVTGRPVIPVTLRRTGTDGSFAGVYVVGIDATYFVSSYGRFDVGREGLIQLVGLDGVARARRASGRRSYGDDMRASTILKEVAKAPSGSFLSAGRLDGVKRYSSFRRVPDYPLVVGVGTSVHETLVGFRDRERMYYLAAMASSLVLTLLGTALALAVRRRQQAMQDLKSSERMHRSTFERSAVGIAHHSLDGRFLAANPSYCAMVGYSEAELLQMAFVDLLPPEERIAAMAARAEALAAGGERPMLVERCHVRKDGTTIWCSVSVTRVDGDDGSSYVIAMVQDITERKTAELRFRATFEQSAVGVVHVTLKGRVITANARFCALTGYTEAELIGRHVDEISHPDDRVFGAESARRVASSANGMAVTEYEKRYLCKDGSVRWASVSICVVRKPNGAPDYFIGMVTDIGARKRAEDMVVHQANYDALTELPNRTLFQDRLAQTLGQARRHQWTAAVMAIDLDRFHVVNDTLGHEIGDELLREVAVRLSQCVRGGDTVARIGGDSFGVIAADLAQAQDASIVAAKIVEALALAFTVRGHEIYIGASVGIAAFPIDGGDAATLVRNADAALSRAKQVGRSNFQFYAAAMNAHAVERLRLESDLRRALERDEFRLHLQPKASLSTGRVVGFEALLRWQRAGNGLVPPGEFIPLLEQTGLIVPVGNWVIRAACAQLAEWRGAALEPLPIAVNLAAKQFTNGDLVTTVNAALAEHGVPAHLLELEVTESDAMQNPEAAIVKLGALRVSGVHVSIDDFGTGYSSLSYLKRFPVDKLKLDRSFVSGLPADAHDASIARAVITMAHSLGLEVVAEGVETNEQRDFLGERGCDQMQGYLLSRPLPPAEAARYLRPARVPEAA